MKLTRNFSFTPALISVIPLINVLFLVLIFFAMSSRFVLQPGLAVTLPTSSFVLAPQHQAQLVSIVSAPIPTIYHHEQKLSMEELGLRLRQSESKERSLIIRADQKTPYDFIVQVMNQGLQNGFSIILATNPPNKLEINSPSK